MMHRLWALTDAGAIAEIQEAMRDKDICCVGMYLGDDPDMITKNVALFEQHCD